MLEGTSLSVPTRNGWRIELLQKGGSYRIVPVSSAQKKMAFCFIAFCRALTC